MLIEFNGSDLRRALRAVSMAAHKDGIRPHLNAVRLGYDAIDASRISAVATNGHWMARWVFRETSAVTERRAPPEHLVVPLDDVRRILAMLGNTPVGELRLWTKTRGVRHGAQHLRLPEVAIAFPAYQSIVPALSTHDGFSAVGLNPEMMIAVSRAVLAGARTKRVHPMVFAFHQAALDPITVTVEDLPEFSAIVMPCRAEFATRLRSQLTATPMRADGQPLPA